MSGEKISNDKVWIITCENDVAKFAFSSINGKFALVQIQDGKIKNASAWGTKKEAEAFVNEFGASWPEMWNLPNLKIVSIKLNQAVTVK